MKNVESKAEQISLYGVPEPADNDGDETENAMQTERSDTNPIEPASGRAISSRAGERHRTTLAQKLDEAPKETYPASDAFVVAWDPRALDRGQHR